MNKLGGIALTTPMNMDPAALAREADSQFLGQGEYGATIVAVTQDGDMTRLAFGRNTASGPAFYLAVHLAPDALALLKSQLTGTNVFE